MGKIVQVAKMGYGAYAAGRAVVGAVSKPAHFLRRSALRAARAALLASIAMAFGDKWAQKALSSMRLEGKTAKGSIHFKVPDWLARWAMDEEGAELLSKVANDAISAPFALIGYGIAKVDVAYSEATRMLRLGVELGAIEIGAAPLPPKPQQAEKIELEKNTGEDHSPSPKSKAKVAQAQAAPSQEPPPDGRRSASSAQA